MMALPRPVSVLLVDDQPHNIVALEAALASVDCRLVKAYSGRDALRCVLAQDFAVIVLDVHMPVMDGFETAGLIRARERSQSTPIIFLTADDRDGPRVPEGYQFGAVDYVFKPFDAAILRAKVAVYVDLFQQDSGSGATPAELNNH
jgi:CheY-like chemotaxis protein